MNSIDPGERDATLFTKEKSEIDVNEGQFDKTARLLFVYTNSDCFLNNLLNHLYNTILHCPLQ